MRVDPLRQGLINNLRFDSLLRWGLGLIFLYASVLKILDGLEFWGVVNNYQLLPGTWTYPLAMLLPWVEGITGLFLLVGWCLRGASTIAFFSLLVFSGAIVFNMARGINVECGCFGIGVGAVSQATMVWYLVRDLILLLWGFWVMRRVFKEQKLVKGY